MAVTREQLVAWLRSEIQHARGYDGDELQQVYVDALKRYRGEPLGDEKDGRSDIVSNDVADMVEAIVAQVLPAFSQDSIAEWEPVDDDDVTGAQAESDAINHLVVEENHGYTMLQSALRDALLVRLGWVRASLDESSDMIRREYVGITREAAAQLLVQLDGSGGVIDDVEVSESDEEDPDEEGLIDLEVRAHRAVRRVRLESVDPLLMSWNADHESFDLEGIRFLSELSYPTRSELIEAGYNRADVERAPQYRRGADSNETARRPEQTLADVVETSQQQVKVRVCHYRYDSDGDGIAELHHIVFLEEQTDASAAILADDIVEFIPYATGTGILQPHQLDGLGVYDKLKEIEKGKTHVLRQWLDNQETANQPGMAYNVNKVSGADLQVRRPGNNFRVDGPIGENLLPIPGLDIGRSCLEALGYFDKVRSERSGASLDLQAQQTLVAGDTAHGIERQISAKELMAAMMTRTLAETLVRQVYVIAHRAMRHWINDDITIRVRGRTTETNPATWRERERLNVSTGLSVAERAQRRDTLGAVLAYQAQLWQAGESDVMVSRTGFYNALNDWMRASQLDGPERYFLDPESDESQQAAQQKAAKAEQQQSVQLQVASQAANAEQQRQLIENALDAWKTREDNRFKYFDARLDAFLEMFKAGQVSASQVEEESQGEGDGAGVAAAGGAAA